MEILSQLKALRTSGPKWVDRIITSSAHFCKHGLYPLETLSLSNRAGVVERNKVIGMAHESVTYLRIR